MFKKYIIIGTQKNSPISPIISRSPIIACTSQAKLKFMHKKQNKGYLRLQSRHTDKIIVYKLDICKTRQAHTNHAYLSCKPYKNVNTCMSYQAHDMLNGIMVWMVIEVYCAYVELELWNILGCLRAQKSKPVILSST